jgi:hypothetical protein
MPGVVDQGSLSSFFVSSPQRQTPSVALESSVTLLNCPVSSEGSFVRALQSALEAWLGMDDVEVTILEVLATGSRGASRLRRRLQGGAPADAVVVRFELAPTSQEGDDADYTMARLQAVLSIKTSEALAEAVSTELETALGGRVENLLAEKGPVERRVAEPEVPSDGGAGSFDVLFVAVAAGAGTIFGACLVCCGCIVWRALSMKLQANTPAAEAATTAAEAATTAAEAAATAAEAAVATAEAAAAAAAAAAPADEPAEPEPVVDAADIEPVVEEVDTEVPGCSGCGACFS